MTELRLHHASWLVPFVRYFQERDISLQRQLQEAGIEPAMAESGDGWIPKTVLYSFLEQLAREMQMPELGFVVGDTIQPQDLGIVGYSMAEAPTLGDAISAFSSMINLRVEENYCWLEADASDASQVWLLNQTSNSFPAKRDLADHTGLMVLANVIRLAEGPDWFPEQCQLQTSSTDAFRSLKGLEHSSFRFEAPATGFRFATRLLFKPLLSGNIPAEETQAWRDLLEPDESSLDKYKRVLGGLQRAGSRVPTLEMLAELCQMSSRSLQRRFQEAGVSFQELLQEQLFQHARSLLEVQELSVTEIAERLGYSGPHNFIRAFKRQEGCTPGEWRQQR